MKKNWNLYYNKDEGCIMNILIIEDDKVLCNELFTLLKNNNYNPTILNDYNVESILKINPDLILLDINLPNINGKEILKNLRLKSDIPVIMLTSLDNDLEEVTSITYGADDYITKPYNPTILLLRINNILKRYKSKITTYQDLTIDISKGTISRENKEIVLTKNEMIIFNYLLNNKNRIVSRDELMSELWGNFEYLNDSALTVNISRLRTKLKELGYDDLIETRKKVGYILK